MLVVLLLPSCYWKKTTLKRIYYNNMSLSSTSFWKLWQLYRKWPPRRRAMVRLMCTLFVARQFWMQPKQEKDRKPLNAKVYLPKMDTLLVPLSPQAKLPNSVQFYSDSWTYPSCRLKEYGQLIKYSWILLKLSKLRWHPWKSKYNSKSSPPHEDPKSSHEPLLTSHQLHPYLQFFLITIQHISIARTHIR